MSVPRHLTPIRRIIELTAEYFDTTVDEILADRRAAEIAVPRQVAYHLAYELTPSSLPVIGRIFRRDHTTVMSGIDALGRRMEDDPLLADQVRQLRDQIAPEIVDTSSLLTASVRMQTRLLLNKDSMRARVDEVFDNLDRLMEERPLASLEALEDLVIRLMPAPEAPEETQKETGETT
jgi:hypothetical protein